MVHITLIASTVLAFIKHHKKSLISVSFLLIFIFSALRYGFGNDYFSYMNIFNTIKITGWHSYLSTNALYILLNKFAPNFQSVIAITSAMFLIPVYFLITRNVEAKYHVIALGIFLFHPYLFIVNLSAIRQSIAVALFICAVYMAMKKKKLFYVLLIIAAMLFHTSAILLLPLYFFINEKKPSVGFLIGFAVVVAILTFNSGAFEWFTGLFEEFLVNNRYDRYLESEEGLSIKALLVAALYIFYAATNIRKLEGKEIVFGKMYLLAGAINLLSYNLILFGRMNFYFEIFSVVAIPLIIAANVKREKDVLFRVLNIYLIPAVIFITMLIKYYNFFFVDETWLSFQTYQTNFAGLFW